MHMTKKTQGFLLISVSWCVLILGLLLLSQVRRVELGYSNLKVAETDLRLRMAAKSALNQILAAMSSEMTEAGATEATEPDAPKAITGKAEEDKAVTAKDYDAYSDVWGWESLRERFGHDFAEHYPGVKLSVAIEDEDSKIDLQKDPVDRLAALFEALGRTKMSAGDAALSVRERTALIKRGALEGEENAGRKDDKGKGAGADAGEEESEAMAFPGLRYLLGLPEIPALSLVGEDLDFNGELDPNEDDGPRSFPPDDNNGFLDKGLTRFLTFQGGDGKVNPNMAPVEVLLSVPGVSERIAEEIVYKRRGGDGVEGTADDFVFRKIDDLHSLGSISRFREFEYNKMKPHMRMTARRFTIRICAASEKTQQIFRLQTSVKREDDGNIVTLAWLEDNGY